MIATKNIHAVNDAINKLKLVVKRLEMSAEFYRKGSETDKQKQSYLQNGVIIARKDLNKITEILKNQGV